MTANYRTIERRLDFITRQIVGREIKRQILCMGVCMSPRNRLNKLQELSSYLVDVRNSKFNISAITH